MKTIENLEKVYTSFFRDLKIDSVTGRVEDTNKRFAAKPAIGSNYDSCSKKILFVSLDIGRDEMLVENGLDIFQDHEYRTNSVCSSRIYGKNPHMAGVYGIALYLLKDEKQWNEEWKILENSSSYFAQILNENHQKLPDDVLSNISLINLYNFVEIGRQTRSGAGDRFFLNESKELQLLIDAINILKPTEIVLQGRAGHNIFRNKVLSNLKHKCNVYFALHPSLIGRGFKYRNPKLYIQNMIDNQVKVQ